MKTVHKNTFVRCWKREYAATVIIHELDDQIEFALCNDRATTRLENRREVWIKKQDEALKPVIALVEQGFIGEDATVLCADLLGKLEGYVADLYHCIFDDNQPRF